MIHGWPCPSPAGPVEAYGFGCLRGRSRVVLVVPALFEEANRTRRMLVGALRELDRAGIDAVLVDLPGCNESTLPFVAQSLDSWREAMAAAASHFAATHVLAIRGGALVAPALPGWALEPATGAAQLRQLIRARTVSSREAGRNESAEQLMEIGRREGLDLAGYRCSAALIGGLEAAGPAAGLTRIASADLGGSPLWLRAEPDDAPDQSAALARILAA